VTWDGLPGTGYIPPTLEEKLARADNALHVSQQEKKYYQARYYELLDKHKKLYIETLNRGWSWNMKYKD